MWFWWMMFAFNLLVPALMILVGRMMWKHCPKEINDMLGYRTKRSMKSQETWKFAHGYCGQLWWKVGWILVIPTVLFQIFLMKSTMNTVGIFSVIAMLLQTAVMLLTIIPTEHALKKNFDENGNAR